MAELKVAILGPKIAKSGVFRPLNLLGSRTNTPIGDKLFQHIPRHVAKFRENRPREVENSVDGKEKTRMLAINVSIPNLTIARLEQFPSPQMTDNKPSFTPKPHVVIFRQSPFAANAVPKLVAMATSLRPSISSMSSLDSLSPKTHP